MDDTSIEVRTVSETTLEMWMFGYLTSIPDEQKSDTAERLNRYFRVLDR